MITDLKALWQEAFRESGDGFFENGFSQDRFRRLYGKDGLAGAVYWFDVTWEGRKYAYIYGLATAKAYRNQGYGKRLMNQTHQQLRRQGYAGVILVPASRELFGYYEKLGYSDLCYVEEVTCAAAGNTPVKSLTGKEYFSLRPQDAVNQETCLSYLQSYASFWTGEGWMLCGLIHENKLYVQEFWGDPDLAPAITASLGAKEGFFRMRGNGRPFAMYYPLTDAPKPTYFGIAMD